MELAGEFADNVPVVLYILWKPFEIAALAAISGVLFDALTLKGFGGVAAFVLANRLDELKAQPSQRHRTGRSSRCTRGAGQCRY